MTKDVTTGYNLRQKTFEEFMTICYKLDEIAQVPKGKKLTYKGGEPLPKDHKKSLDTISKMNRGVYPDPKPDTESTPKPTSATGKRGRINFIDRSTASTQGQNTRRGPRSRFAEENEIEEGIGMTMASALGNPPALSNRMKLKKALIAREVKKNAAKNKKRRYSGKAVDPNANTRRGPGARRSDQSN